MEPIIILIFLAGLIIWAIFQTLENRNNDKLKDERKGFVDRLLLRKGIKPYKIELDITNTNCIGFGKNQIWCGIITNNNLITERLIQNFTTSNHSCFIDSTGGNCIAVDIENRKIIIINIAGGSITCKEIDFSSIISVELINSGTTIFQKSITGTVGRALVGGVLAGGVGAIVGGTTGAVAKEDKCTSLVTKLMIRDISNPIHEIYWYRSFEGQSNIEYFAEYKSAQKAKDIISTIIDKVESEAKVTAIDNSKSSADEIMKLHKLKEIGAITAEEFEQEKHNLLGR